MKLFKLIYHQKGFSPEDILLNPKEHPGIKQGDIVEIYNTEEDEACRLLLQVNCLTDDFKGGRDTISIEQSIGMQFNLRCYSDVYLRVVDKKSVSLDSVEITFKDQYLGRSEMWQLKQYMTDTCVYINKKVEYLDGIIRCQVYEMWSNGDRVACGLINEDTKIVFRSSTSMVYLFIQMSSEMWDFDIHGDLYFEKAVNGFLAELFAKWKKLGSNHEVTIVLFSRTFYEAKSLDEFPSHMRECLQEDYKGRFYEDFYRVAIQNERNDDWSTVLVQLRRLFTAYQNIVLKYHERPGITTPPAFNSTAAQGNFLEVLNISLNVFEKHYLDRSFDRTGQLSVVITPSVGVFEVDRELTNITKQRIIDNGVSSDLVCVGEQPLHAVPLLKFHYKDASLSSVDDYSMPHWINLSFYSTNKKVAYSTFIPRIRLPPRLKDDENQTEQDQKNKLEKQKALIGADDSSDQGYIHNSLFDYDAYDEQIFQLPQHGTITSSLQRVPRTKKTSVPSLMGNYSNSTPREIDKLLGKHHRKMSDPDIHHSTSNIFSSLMETSTPITEKTIAQSMIHVIKQKRSLKPTSIMRGRALINPFDPSHVTIKLTSNRRRWSHIFPKGPTGVLIQQHHYQAIPTNSNTQSPENNSNSTSSSIYNLNNLDEYAHTTACQYNKSRSNEKFEEDDQNQSHSHRISICSSSNSEHLENCLRRKKSSVQMMPTNTPSKSLTLLWGATGEQEWTPALTTGVDWKSLTIPACLPITTDFFPDSRSLNNDYVVSDYTLLPDDVNTEFMRTRAVFRDPLSTFEVFNELVSQRLAQGFQLIVLPEQQENPSNAPCCGGKLHDKSITSNLIPAAKQENSKEYLLSIGRIFHKISLTGSEIKVTRYRPRHPYPPINVDYRYRFHAPQHDNYEVSGVNFTTEKLENFHWNYMDQYICTRGDTDFVLHEGLKYWRFRMYLLPKEDFVMKRIMENNLQKCDIYPKDMSLHMQKQQIEDFLRLIETHLNKIRKSVVKRPRGSPTTQQTHLTRRRHSTSTSILSRPSAHEKPNNNPNNNSHHARSGSKIETRSYLAAIQVNLAEKKAAAHGEGGDFDDDDCFVTEPPKFKPTTPITEIFEAFKNPVTGVPLLNWMPSFPSNVFGSYDAIGWVYEHSESNCNPLEILENMRRKKWICHASGDFSVPIRPGFYIYYIVIPNSPDMIGPMGDLEAFENEWCEVEVPWKYIEQILTVPTPSLTPTVTVSEKIMDENDVPVFLQDDIEKRNLDGRLYRQSHLEIDLSNKSERTEFGHCKYHRQFHPGYAFEICVQWIRASGPIVSDLAYNWSRKATQCGFQLVSIPTDPMAEPFVEKSDPLRGPIFIPLNVDCLMQNRTHLFEEFKKDTWAERMLLFQDSIVRRFGFVPVLCESKTGSNDISADWHFVHCTGNMFIMVPSPCHGNRATMRRLGMTYCSSSSNSSTSSGTHKKLCNYYQQNSSESTKENYISRHVNIKGQNGLSQSKESVDSNFGASFSSQLNGNNKSGFLWQWNHMIPNKKWKSLTINQTDELFQLRLLRDFKDFCSNVDGRLLKFWDESWEFKEKLSLMNSGRVN